MAAGVKEDGTMPKGGSKWFKLSIIFLFLSISSFVVPVTGFSLKNTCRVSRDAAICARCNLSAVPQDIPSTVKVFDLAENKILKIKELDFKNVPDLIELDLKRNKITQIAKGAFANLHSLMKLSLNNNRFGNLGENIFDGLSNLTELRMVSNRIETVASTTFKPLTNLRFLDISFNNLKELKKVNSIIQQLPSLRELVIRKIGLKTFLSWQLTNTSIKLASLDLSQNQISVFRIHADVFPNLNWFNIGATNGKKPIIWDVRNKTFLSQVKTLDIGGLHLALNDMKSFFESFNSSLTILRMNTMKRHLASLINISCTIPTLSTLTLQHNNIKSTDLFQACVSVTELDLALNRIENVSINSFKTLRGLRILSLSRNMLSSVPSVIRNIPTLAELDLSTNKISSLRCEDFANLTKLWELSLHQNSISALKDCVFKDLIRLEVLKLQTNQITKLGQAFNKTSLPNLKQLRLNGNKLTDIKYGQFKGLPSLQNLTLHDNKIKMLHNNSFIGLTYLTDIQLQNNEITQNDLFKDSFNHLINLRRLDLRNNHIQYKFTTALPYPPFSQLSRLETLFLLSQHHRGKSRGLPSNILEGLTNLLVFNTRNSQLLSLHVDMFKHTPKLEQLDITANDFMDVSPELFSPIRNLKSLYISQTNLLSLDFLIKANLTKLEFLQARKNGFSVIREDIMKSVPALRYLDLEFNGFTCDCDNAWFLQWAENNNQTQVFGAYDFLCNYPPNFKGMKLKDLDIRSCSVDIGFFYFISTTCTILLFMLASFIYHFLRWQVVYAYYLFLALLFDSKQKSKNTPYQYDAFISYNVNDEPWVIKEMLPKLEGEQGWRLCLHHRDFQPGKPIIENIADAIYACRKTICVISQRYLESEWCSREIQTASYRLFEEKKDVLILVFLEEIPASHLSPYYRMRKLLKKRTYLSWPQAKDHTAVFWEKVRRALETSEDPGEDRFLLRVVNRF